MHIAIHPHIEELETASLAVEQALRKAKVSDEERVRALLTLEEVLAKLIELADPNSLITLRLVRTLSSRKIKISCRGRQIDLNQIMDLGDCDLTEGLMAPEAEDHIREIILQSQSERLNATYNRGINSVSLTVTQSKHATLINTLVGVVLGLLTGIVVRSLCAPSLEAEIAENIFSPMFEIFLTAIKMVMGPLVFFSLVNSLIGLNDLRSLGRIGGKVVGWYFVTAISAVAIVISLMYLLEPGEFGSMAGVFTQSADVEQPVISPIRQLLHIVPDSFVSPFVTTDMLQVLFLAICFGLTAATLGKYSLPICTFVESMSELFSKLMSMISRFLPLAVFGSMANMVLSMDAGSAIQLMSLLGTIVLCVVLMLGVYSALLFSHGINPWHTFRSHLDAVITAASSFSASAAMPVAMRCCREEGISPRIYSFSIPLGSTINMDGLTVNHMAVVLFLASLCGVHIGVGSMVTLVMMVLLMALATPSAPGAALACQTMLLAMVGVPTSSLALVLALDSLLEPLLIAMETLSDGVVTSLVAKSETEV